MKGRGCCCSLLTSNISGPSLNSLEGSRGFWFPCYHPTLIPLLGPGKRYMWLSFQWRWPNPVFLPPETLMDDSAHPQSPAVSLGPLSQPGPRWPLVFTSPATLPQTPVALTHFCRLYHGVGLWLNWKREKKKKVKQPAIWNLNETKFISLCCHFIFHHFDSEGTGDPRGPFCFAHQVERWEEEGGEGLTGRRKPRPSISLLPHQNHSGGARTSALLGDQQ